ncbi:hypothetical protein BHE74_00057452 [Ensete ventricosum]|nr:hypothetical protein BHE74_00057452 [Ensete ventricosum]
MQHDLAAQLLSLPQCTEDDPLLILLDSTYLRFLVQAIKRTISILSLSTKVWASHYLTTIQVVTLVPNSLGVQLLCLKVATSITNSLGILLLCLNNEQSVSCVRKLVTPLKSVDLIFNF